METMFLSMRDNRKSRGIMRSQSELMKVSVTIPTGGNKRMLRGVDFFDLMSFFF